MTAATADHNCFDRVFEDVAERIKAVYNGERFCHSPRCEVPDALATIIRDCFMASLRAEEKRPTRIRIICADPETTDVMESSSEWDYARFVNEDKTPFNPHTLAKLAAGVQGPNAAVLVWPENSCAKIHGVVRVANNAWGLSTPHAPWNHRIRKALSITVKAPGSFVVDNLEQVIGEFAEGRLHESIDIFNDPSPFKSLIDELGTQAFAETSDLLGTAARPHEEPGLPPGAKEAALDEWRSVYRFTLRSTLECVQQHECGGTLIVTTNDNPQEVLRDKGYVFRDRDLGREIDGLHTLQSRMADYFDSLQQSDVSRLHRRNEELTQHAHAAKGTNAEDGAWDRKSQTFSDINQIHKLYADFAQLAHAIKFVGNLTAADGATIVLPSLRVYAMGAKVRTSQSSEVVAKQFAPRKYGSLQGDSGDTPPADLFDALPPYDKQRGTRFWSGVSYANKVEKSLVFVASVDGILSACMSLGNGVVVAEPVGLGPLPSLPPSQGSNDPPQAAE